MAVAYLEPGQCDDLCHTDTRNGHERHQWLLAFSESVKHSQARVLDLGSMGCRNSAGAGHDGKALRVGLWMSTERGIILEEPVSYLS